MSIRTVRMKIVLGFSAIILLMVALCGFAYIQLRDIEAQATELRAESVPGLYLDGRLQAASISTYTSVQQMILEHDPARMQQLVAYLESKTTERLELLKKYEPTVRTDKQRELFEATKTALAPYMVVRHQVERLSKDLKTKADAAKLQRDQLEPLYVKLQEAIEAQLGFNKATADEDGQRIQDTVARARTGMMLSLIIGVLLAMTAGYLVVQAIDRPLARLVAAMELLRSGDFSQKIALAQEGEFGVLANGLNQVTDSLQEMAKKARQVADGNLAIEVKGLSEKDILGSALAEMVEKLSALIRRVQKSGLQVNTSATEIAARRRNNSARPARFPRPPPRSAPPRRRSPPRPGN
jgi:methyl-accepting chemotaxis protein WspA